MNYIQQQQQLEQCKFVLTKIGPIGPVGVHPVNGQKYILIGQ